jgi:hypothetical protein
MSSEAASTARSIALATIAEELLGPGATCVLTRK